jgi:hypothetical protein
MWNGFALFDVDGAARPAWNAFASRAEERRAPLEPVYLESGYGRITPVPLGEARLRAEKELVRLLRRHGRVNTGYIRAITAEEAVVSGYRINLRASLSGNLDLVRQSVVEDPGSWEKTVDAIDPVKQRLVVFTRDDAATAEIARRAASRGIEMVLHPLPADVPLKFGLGQAWQKVVAITPEEPEIE